MSVARFLVEHIERNVSQKEPTTLREMRRITHSLTKIALSEESGETRKGLIEALSHPDSRVRRVLAYGLHRIYREAKRSTANQIMQEFKEASEKQENEVVRRRINEVIRKCMLPWGEEEEFWHEVHCLWSQNNETREKGFSAIRRRGKAAFARLSRIITQWYPQHPEMHEGIPHVIKAIKEIGLANQETLRALAKLTHHESDEIRRESSEALAELIKKASAPKKKPLRKNGNSKRLFE